MSGIDKAAPTQGADARPVAIYQIELDSVTYEDVSREKYERAFPGARARAASSTPPNQSDTLTAISSVL